MRVTFLGTGTSHGVPMIGCQCAVCQSTDPRNQRLRPSIWIETEAISLLVDATPDFRQQALRAGIGRLDTVLLTHTHADHFLGLDDLRVYTQRQAMKMPVYGNPVAMADVQRVFPYACTERPAWPTMPSFGLTVLQPDQEFQVGDLNIRAVALPHGRVEVYGYLFGRELAYLTDCNAVPPSVVETIQGVRVLVIDALRTEPHIAHLTIAQACEIAGRVGASLTLFTHLCHDADHAATESALPPNVRVAYDGLRLEIDGDQIKKLA
jgi:phosphoribosyl 1,2-cyclic phosphate phosphodiesterase